MGKKEELYLGKKVSELNIYEQRFRKMMQLIKIKKVLDKSMEVKSKLPFLDYPKNSTPTIRY